MQGHTSVDQQTKTYIHQLSAETECYLEYLFIVMANSNK